MGFLCSYRMDNAATESLSFGHSSECRLPNYRRRFMNMYLKTFVI